MRITVKIGTSTLAHATGRLNIQRVEKLCKVLSDLKNAGHEIILVSSGAIGMGVGKLNLPGRPADMPGKQAAAAVGQCELMYVYDKLFAEYNHTVAQLLLTGEDIRSEQRSRNVRNTLSRLLELGALPVINENDAVATDEIGVENTIGENDTLSAIVAAAIGADLLVLLSDIDGLYDSDPHENPDAKIIPVVGTVDEHIYALAVRSGCFFRPAQGGRHPRRPVIDANAPTFQNMSGSGAEWQTILHLGHVLPKIPRIDRKGSQETNGFLRRSLVTFFRW